MARELSRRSSQRHRTGVLAQGGGPPPRGQYSAKVPWLAEARAATQRREQLEPPWGPAFPTGGRGRGGPSQPPAALKLPRPPNHTKNALPPRRLPGLPSLPTPPPPPFPVDLDPVSQFTVKSSEPVVWICAPSHKSGLQKGSPASGYLCSGRPRFLVLLSQIRTWEHLSRNLHNPAGQGTWQCRLLARCSNTCAKGERGAPFKPLN
jgi:hypothetical protein